MKRYLLRTFGCQMNVHDSLRIEELLCERGYRRAESAERADLVIFNTCCVREKAERKLLGAVGALRQLKQRNAALVVAVAGCMAQQHGPKLLDRLPLVDLLLGPDNIALLPELLEQVGPDRPRACHTEFDLDMPVFLGARTDGPAERVSAYVTVMKGCNERCSYCVVPGTRGPERYRPAREILDEIERLVLSGVREITLLGQTVNGWREPSGGGDPAGSAFAGLLRRIAAEVPALERLRYTAPHPAYLTPELIRAHAEFEVLPWHLHLPAQSGSDRVLRRMVRRYTRSSYLQLAGQLRQARPGITLSTDLIVGFPGESEEDFQQTLSLVSEAGFSSAFAFKYSPRPGTAALKLGEPVAEPVKEERLARLLERIDAVQAEHLQGLVGQRTRVLVEERNRKDPERFTGRSHRNEIVHVKPPPGVDPTGLLAQVVIEQANRHSLLGSMEPGA
jgi:tRNA-2-methylthio-N6-dimethylallyladenosine synthase